MIGRNQRSGMAWLMHLVVVLGLVIPFVFPSTRAFAEETVEAASVSADTPEWLEARGIHIVDLVGAVPESMLRGATVSYWGGNGALTYLEGRRELNHVYIKVKVSARWVPGWFLGMNCLGQRAWNDHWFAVAPESEMRLFSGDTDITHLVRYLSYYPASLTQPITGSTLIRYEARWLTEAEFTEDGAVRIPANMGCEVQIEGFHENLTAEFRLRFPKAISVEVLGSQSFTFHTYIGPGYAGKLESLVNQMGRFGNRHEKFILSIPEGTEFVFVNYPLQGASPSVNGDEDYNIRQPTSGTYRLANSPNTLSTDYQISMGLPLQGVWQDSDQAGDRYLRRMQGVNMLTAPEYFLPPTIPYDPCMRYGGCPLELLEAIHDEPMQLTVYYLRVERVIGGLQRIPLRLVGNSWKPGSLVVASPATLTLPQPIFIPQITTSKQVNIPPDDRTDCPCGWFTSEGRLVDFIPE